MKKILIATAAALSLAACQNNSYTVNGITDEAMEGKTAYLINSGTNTVIDSCVIANKAFAITRTDETPQIARVQIGRRNHLILTEPGSTITVDFTATAPGQEAVIDNGGANDRKSAFMKELNTFLTAKREKYEAMLQNGTPQNEVMEYSMQAQIELNNIYKQNIADNRDNIYGAFMLGNVAGNLYGTIAELDSVIATVKYAGEVKQLESLRTSLINQENTKEGKPFIDFKGKSIDGTETALSQYVGNGKYTLIDFWASWCGPCRGEIPNLKEVSKLYGGEQFQVIGVNVWDQEQKFKESLKSEAIDYAQIYVPTNVNVTDLYGIKGIPQIMLIGPDGTILKRNLRGEGIKAAVKEALGK